MSRTERKIMRGWEFALESKPPRWVYEEDYGMNEAQEPLPYVLPKGLRFESVNLPHDWAVDAPIDRHMDQGNAQGYRNRWGIGWYRKNLVLEEKRQGYMYCLDFGGVYENCAVWVNQKYVGGQRYGYSPFRLDVTEALAAGENKILVKVDNTIAPVDRWYSGCGIYRTVKLVEVREQHLDPWEVVVHTRLVATDVPDAVETADDRAIAEWKHGDRDAMVTVNVGRKGFVSGQLEELEIAAVETAKDMRGDAEIGRRADTTVRFQAESAQGVLTFRVHRAKLWSAEEPNLYQLTLTLWDGNQEADAIQMRIGLRQVDFIPDKGMFVNGRMVKLKGVCLHQEAGCAGIAVEQNLWRQRLENLKEMGCNAIRTAHHVYAEEFLDLCDEMGFYVYEECFDKWSSGLYGRYFNNDWQKDLEVMVKRDRNRPSVIIWGVGNEVENQAQDSMLKILSMLRKQVRSLDETRPVTYAMNPHFSREKANLTGVKDIQKIVDETSSTEIFDPVERVEKIAQIAEIVDIIACNYQEQWYELIHGRVPDKLILGTEVYQYFMGHYDQIQNFTQKNPALISQELDYCIGSFLWTGYDYLGESMGYPAKGWSGAAIHTDNKRRSGFYLLQSYWKKEPMIHFSVLDQSQPDEGVKEHWDMPCYMDHWHFPQFHMALIPYMIATNCEEAALYLNGKRFYLPKPSESPNHLITGFLPWQPGEVKVVGIMEGKEVCSHVTVTPGAAVSLRFDILPGSLTIEEGRQMFCTVRAVDWEGNPCFRECGKVSFRAEGPVRILGVDNGDITGGESLKENHIHLYHGSAGVLLEFTGGSGRVNLWADGAGLRSGQVILNVE